MTGNNSVLVTGGFGNLGSWLTSWFVEKGYDVTVLSHSKKDFLTGSRFSVITCDISDNKACETALSGKNFDYVIHTASANDTFETDYARKALVVNAFGTRNILQNLQREQLKHFIYFSTFHVYGASYGIIGERSPVGPKHDYATTHLFAEYYVKQFHQTHKIPYTILRLTNSYGCPKDVDSSKWYLVLNDLARMAFEKKEIVLRSNGQAQRDFIWMGTVCEVVGALLELPAAPDDFYNLGSGTSSRLTEIATAVQQAYQKVYGITLSIRVNENDKTSHDNDLKVDTSKLRSLVKFNPQNKFREEAENIFRMLENAR
jgi:UDP-glucose 4-epimerase